ncbi:MAG: dynamin family protein [Deltaproteobacteria bacterium]|nr:dynamin family protein [Deltaproteobacteria bacterium]
MPETGAPQELIREIGKLQELAREWTALFPQAASQGEHWLKVLGQVQAHVSEDTCRLAVVGAVKSGKSTMINALIGQDLLRRGAGILTAMITRVQPGPEPQAVLQFKDWSEINGEIQRAVGMLPNPRLAERAALLDLQQAEDRVLLKQVLAEARGLDLWRNGSLDQNYLLLQSYLEGYGLLQDLLPGTGVLKLSGPELARHRELVTREATAVYLKDVLLTIPFPWPAQGVELGDCQGSDSPTPQHLAQVLAYLVKSDLVLYVISSRVGLRQADFQFLSELQRMGLAPHILSLLNLDLGEHTSFDELGRIRDQVAQELGPWQPQVRLYAFSALKLLLDRKQTRGKTLDPREAAVLQVWGLDPASATFSDQEAARFENDLQALLQELRHRRLAGGALSQVKMVARGLREQLGLARDLLQKGMGAIKEMEARLEARRQPLKGTMASLSQTLEGAGSRLKKEIRRRVDHQLDWHGGPIGGVLRDFIRKFEPNWDELTAAGTPASFRPALYQLFQEFAKALAQFVTSEVNITLVEFIRDQEEWLRQELGHLWTPLFLALQEALTLYYHEIEELGLPATPPTLEVASINRPQGLEMPLLTLSPAPGWRFAREVWLRSGLGFLGRAWESVKKRLGLGKELEPRSQLQRDLERALISLKDWLHEEVQVQLLDYRERLKFQYFFPLVDQWLKQQEACLEDTLGSLLGSLSGLTATVHLEETERQAREQRLEQMIPAVQAIEGRLAGPVA